MSEFPGKTEQILAGLNDQNHLADFDGQKGFWVQGDCVFIPEGEIQGCDCGAVPSITGSIVTTLNLPHSVGLQLACST